jgi:uncharacterized protein
LDATSIDYLKLAQQTFWGEEIHFASPVERKLVGNIHYPPDYDRTAKYPAVILMHGLGGNRHEVFGLFLKAAATLALNGFVVLRFDGRGAGDTGGSTRLITFSSLIADLACAFRYMQENESVDPSRVGILGLSMGGLTAACLSGSKLDIAALALWEAPFDLFATLTRLLGPLHLPAIKAQGYYQAGLLQLSAEFFESIHNFDPSPVVADYSNPVLILHGTEDHIVLPDSAQRWQEAFSGTQPDVVMLPEADHAFTRDAWAWPAINTTTEWFKKVLQPR